MSRTDKFIGIDFKSSDVYIKEMCMTKAEMLAFAYGTDGKFTVCSEDKKVYVYDSTYTDTTTGHFKVASNAVFYDLDTSTIPAESWHTTSDYDNVIQRKAAKDTVLGRYDLTAEKMTDGYSITDDGIERAGLVEASFVAVEAGWTTTYSSWFTSSEFGSMIRYTKATDGNNYCEHFPGYTDHSYSECKYCVNGKLYDLAGTSGASDYTALTNKPTVNGVELNGNKSSTDLKFIWVGTSAQYTALATKDAQTLYCITDDNATSVTSGSYSKAEVDALLNDKQSVSSSGLNTVAKTIVGAINENKQTIAGLSGAVNIQVVETLPDTPVERTIYYVGSAAPYTMKLYVNGAYTELGTTSADLSGYIKTSDIINSLTDTSTNKPLSANMGKSLNDSKLSLSGGTMTGELSVKSNTDFSIHSTNNNTYIGLSGGDGNSAYNGCVLFLTGKDQADWHGGFGLRCCNGTSASSKTLGGKPDGTLTWDGHQVETTVLKTGTAAGLTVAGVGSLTATIGKQVRIEHHDYYEYYLIITVSGFGSSATTMQEEVCQVMGLQGTGFYTHQPVPVWCESGNGKEQGLWYGNESNSYASLYLGMKEATNNDRRFLVHTIRFK